ncbi:MAG: AAA family ATPase [Defluviicoccus sp.]|nr:AAA family ATPase [Defluviicoccus sp.]MDG4610243.1 AAA family ATPase [Defluviicoccus sp.]
MKFNAFRIRKYRSIQDSGWVELDDDLTCIVGKNQSGKTALLKALHKFNPHLSEPYDMVREWPRGQRRDRSSKQVVCETRFVLDDEERKHLGDISGTEISINTVVVTKDYDGNFEISVPDHPDLFRDTLHPNTVDEIANRIPTPHQDSGEQFKKVAAECTNEARRYVKEGRFSELGDLKQGHIEKLQGALTPGNPAPHHQRESEFQQQYEQILNQIVAEVQNLPTIRREVHDWVVGRIPTFIYMDEYQEFAGTAQLEEVQRHKASNQLTPQDQTFLMILDLSGLDLDQLVEQGRSGDKTTIRERQHDLDDAAVTLTRDVAGRWGQNPYKIEFRADGQIFLTEIEETNKQIGMIPLEDQSRGFRWFFSFDLRFMHDSKGTFEGCVLLLDEPGLHLHPGGQSDLLRRLDAYAEKNSLIYTTHLPFLVDLREPSRIRVIRQEDYAGVVTSDFGASGPDEKLTLQAALGMKLNQHYLVAQRNLIVEGVDDAWIITELSNLLSRLGKQTLPDDVQITAAGGASEVVYMATLMIGQGLEVVALFDSDDAGRREENKLRTKWLLRYKDTKSSSVLLGDAIGTNGDVSIEDLFPEAYYLGKVEESHKSKMENARVLKIEPRQGEGLMVNRIADGCKNSGIQFNKGAVANLIRKDLARKTDANASLNYTIEKAELLFQRIRSQFD